MATASGIQVLNAASGRLEALAPSRPLAITLTPSKPRSGQRHLHALRAFVLGDLLRRCLERDGHQVRYVGFVASEAEALALQEDLGHLELLQAPELLPLGKSPRAAPKTRPNGSEPISQSSATLHVHVARRPPQLAPPIGPASTVCWIPCQGVIVADERAGHDYRVRAIGDTGLPPASLRYLFLTAHHSSRLAVHLACLENAANALESLTQRFASLDSSQATPISSPAAGALRRAFHQALQQDLDTQRALAALWQLARSDLADSEKRALLEEFDHILGLGLCEVRAPTMPEGASQLIQAREAARRRKDWSRADALRAELLAMNIEVRDSPSGGQYIPAGRG